MLLWVNSERSAMGTQHPLCTSQYKYFLQAFGNNCMHIRKNRLRKFLPSAHFGFNVK